MPNVANVVGRVRLGILFDGSVNGPVIIWNERKPTATKNRTANVITKRNNMG